MIIMKRINRFIIEELKKKWNYKEVKKIKNIIEIKIYV